MAADMADFAAALGKKRSKVVVIAHRDCDALEPAHEDNSKSLEDDLQAAGVPNPIAATPAWELETWWMLFPEALAARRGCWRGVDYSNRKVGMIQNAKERLISDLRPPKKGGQCRDYTESDSPIIAAYVADAGLVRDKARWHAASLKQFGERVLALLG